MASRPASAPRPPATDREGPLAVIISALALLGVALVYFLVTTTVDVFPLNNVRGATRAERGTEVAINGPILATPIILVSLAAAMQIPILAFIGGGIELLVAAGGLALWWLPYLAGVTVPWATAGIDATWGELHARTYARTIIVLPRIGNRPTPNLEHMILHLLLLAGGILAILTGVRI